MDLSLAATNSNSNRLVRSIVSIGFSLGASICILVVSGCASGWPGQSDSVSKPFGNSPIFGADRESPFGRLGSTRDAGETAPRNSSPIRKTSFEATASAVTWFDSYDDGVAESAATGRPMLLLFTGSDWCSWCIRLKQDVLDQPEFKAWAADKVVLVELDFPRTKTLALEKKTSNDQLKRRYDITGFPTVVLVDAAGQTLGKLGYMKNPSAFIAAAESKLRAAKSN